MKPWQCVNLTVFISFNGRQACSPPPSTHTHPHQPSHTRPLVPVYTAHFQWPIQVLCRVPDPPPPLRPPVPAAEKQSQLIDFDPISPTSLHTFMSPHVLTEFGGGGYKSSGWDWQSCPRSLGPTRSGCKVAIYAATPGREGSADLEIMTLPPLLRFTLTISAHDLISFVPAGCVRELAGFPAPRIQMWPNNLHHAAVKGRGVGVGGGVYMQSTVEEIPLVGREPLTFTKQTIFHFEMQHKVSLQFLSPCNMPVTPPPHLSTAPVPPLLARRAESVGGRPNCLSLPVSELGSGDDTMRTSALRLAPG